MVAKSLLSGFWTTFIDFFHLLRSKHQFYLGDNANKMNTNKDRLCGVKCRANNTNNY